MSTKALTTMIAAMTNYFGKIKRVAKPIRFESGLVINGSGTKQYDIKTMFPDYARYNLLSTRVTVTLLNSEANSPTRGYYINSEATITVALNSDGIIIIQNTSPNNANVNVRIDYPNVLR